MKPKGPRAKPKASNASRAQALYSRREHGIVINSGATRRATGLRQESSKFLDIILGGNRRTAYRMLKACYDSRDLTYVYEEVVCPAMRELGEMWARDEVSVAQEHLATATADAAIVGLYPDLNWPLSRTSRVFVACPEGERHALGARMLADLLALDGWDELYFGADVPIETLAQEAAEHHPQVVALSVAIKNNLANTRSAAEAIRSASPGTKILAGGRAVLGASREHAVALTASDIVAESAAEAVRLIRAWR